MSLSDHNSPRILKYPWHIGHDYELFKVPFQWSLLTDTSRSWAWSHRPLPDDVRLVSTLNPGEQDIMVLHVDQWILDEPEKLQLFNYWKNHFSGPKIVLCHGCNLVDGCSSEDLRELVGDLPTVVNTPTALDLWGFENARFILHGFSPDEWPETDYSSQKVVVIQAWQGTRHLAFRNHSAVEKTEASGVELTWVGRDLKLHSFDEYREFLSHQSIFFNPSHASPNPRTKAEAMLCGLAIVTTCTHGEDAYIENGVNGFCSNDLEELIGYLKQLQADPELTRRIGQAGRETARQQFHIDRFRKEWTDLVSEMLNHR